MSKPVVVLVTSAICGPCREFKRDVLPKLKEKISKGKIVDFVHLETQGMDFNFKPEGFNPKIKNFVSYFPSLLIFSGKTWKNHYVNLVGEEIKTQGSGGFLDAESTYKNIEKISSKYKDSEVKKNFRFKSTEEIIPSPVSIKPWPILTKSVKEKEFMAVDKKEKIEVFDSRIKVDNQTAEIKNKEINFKRGNMKKKNSQFKFVLARI